MYTEYGVPAVPWHHGPIFGKAMTPQFRTSPAGLFSLTIASTIACLSTAYARAKRTALSSSGGDVRFIHSAS